MKRILNNLRPNTKQQLENTNNCTNNQEANEGGKKTHTHKRMEIFTEICKQFIECFGRVEDFGSTSGSVVGAECMSSSLSLSLFSPERLAFVCVMCLCRSGVLLHSEQQKRHESLQLTPKNQ